MMRLRKYVMYATVLAMLLFVIFYFNQPITRFFLTLSKTLLPSRSNITIRVPDNYTSIQAAVDSAIAGDTIYVEGGIYVEEIVVKKNNIRLLGENPNTTIIDANLGIGLNIEADNTIISGFTIKNCGTALSVYKSSNCSIYRNHITSNKFGILLSYSSNCRIYENNVTDNEHDVRLDYSTDNYLADNTINSDSYNFGVYGSSLEHYIQKIDTSNTVNGKPIYYIINARNFTADRSNHSDAGCLIIVNSSNITIKDLTLSNNLNGILLAYTSEATIENVTAINNKVGIGLYSCSNCTISNTVTVYNAYQGIKLAYSPTCVIHKNNVTGNTEGIYMVYSNNCTIETNTIKTNECGIKLDHASNSTFYHNNIIDNTRQTQISDSPENMFDNGLEGNYWSDHASQDSNHDGICDTPYICTDSTTTDRYPLMVVYQTSNG
jgi:parallel beta-helix repeat protein